MVWVRPGGIKSKQLSCERGTAEALSATCAALKWGPWKTRQMQSRATEANTLWPFITGWWKHALCQFEFTLKYAKALICTRSAFHKTLGFLTSWMLSTLNRSFSKWTWTSRWQKLMLLSATIDIKIMPQTFKYTLDFVYADYYILLWGWPQVGKKYYLNSLR